MSQVLIHRRDAETRRRQMHFLCGLCASAVNILAGLRSKASLDHPYGIQATNSISTRVAVSGNSAPTAERAGASFGKYCA